MVETEMNREDGLPRLFSALGLLVFVAGWAGILFLIFDSGNQRLGLFQAYGGSSQGRVYIALQHGTLVTIAAGILWGIAVLATSRRRPK